MNSMHGAPYFPGTNIGGRHTQLQIPNGCGGHFTGGFFPQNAPNPNNPNDPIITPRPGEVRQEQPMQNPDAQTSYRACPESVSEISDSIRNSNYNPGDWSLISAPGAPNCTGWACEQLQGAGFTPPMKPQGAYPNAHVNP